MSHPHLQVVSADTAPPVRGVPTSPSSLQFDNVLDDAPIGYFEVDARGVVLHANRAGCEGLGLDARRIHKPVFAAYLHAKSMYPFYWLVKKLLETSRPASCDLQVRRPDGKTYWVRFDGAVRSPLPDGQRTCLLSMIDISEQREAESRLRASEQRLRCLIESIPDSIFVIRNGAIVFTNAAAERLVSGENRSQLIGRPIEDLIMPEDHDLLVALSGLEFRPVPTMRPLEMRFRAGDGQPLTADTTWLALQFEGEHSLLCVARDQTDRKQMQARLAQADRLTTAGVLAAGVAHEINNPLTYIFFNLESLRADLVALQRGETVDVEAANLAADRAMGGAHRVRDIVKDLRSCTTDSDAREMVSINDVIDKTLEIAQPQLRYKASVERAFGQVPALPANFGRLSQAFLNLFVNAAQAIPEGGPSKQSLRVATEATPTEIRILVQDTGAGIPEHARARLFEPFFTTKDVGSGSGLGLYICHKYLSQYGGSIELVDLPPYATSFLIRFPHQQQGQSPLDQKPSPKLVPEVKARGETSLRLLLVDDDGVIRTELQHALAPRFHSIVTAGSGSEAISLLRETPGFDLVLCDVLMPDGSGPDVYRWLARHQPDMLSHIGFITGGAYTDDARAFFATHTVHCLDKPFSREDLAAFLELLLPRDEATMHAATG
ncbi:MAG: PAS domain S-box protein [Myxococcales bacterium FL481]|nr:MAG: PAS domain S-box protein [Myxococcales bacterium FL481]